MFALFHIVCIVGAVSLLSAAVSQVTADVSWVYV